MAKSLTDDQREMYVQFMMDHERCWACGWMPWATELRDWMFPRLENAHIRGGPARTHDRRNISRLCNGCHRLLHKENIRVRGVLLPHLTQSHIVYLKAKFDVNYYDLAYLDEIGIGKVDRPRRVPEWFLRQNDPLLDRIKRS